tara:strand:+ start:1894 stop:2373 length:480 start_codon:yes stop_codon:yes gene_type:complete
VKIILVSYLEKEGLKMPVKKIAPAFPLEINEETGNYKEYGMTDLTKVVDQNLKMVLLTSPGEKLMNQNFGVGLRKYLFENNSAIKSGVQYNNGKTVLPLRENIISQVSMFLPYIRIQELEIGGSAYENMLVVKIKYFIQETQTSSTFELTVSEVRDNTL